MRLSLRGCGSCFIVLQNALKLNGYIRTIRIINFRCVNRMNVPLNMQGNCTDESL